MLAQNFFLTVKVHRGRREDLWPFWYGGDEAINTAVQLWYDADMVWGLHLGV